MGELACGCSGFNSVYLRVDRASKRLKLLTINVVVFLCEDTRKGTKKRHNCAWAEKTMEPKIHCDVACPFKSAGLDNINFNLKMF